MLVTWQERGFIKTILDAILYRFLVLAIACAYSSYAYLWQGACIAIRIYVVLGKFSYLGESDTELSAAKVLIKKKNWEKTQKILFLLKYLISRVVFSKSVF